jgi:hypothetical protein
MQAACAVAASDQERSAIVAGLMNSGQVRLYRNAAGATMAPPSTLDAAT